MSAQQQNSECPICLNGMATGAALFTTSCGHQFHFDCIKDSILHNNLQCPLCRGPVNQLTRVLTPAIAPAPAAVTPPNTLPLNPPTNIAFPPSLFVPMHPYAGYSTRMHG